MPEIPDYHLYIGVDPGASGGVAVIGGAEPCTWAMPTTEADLWDLVRSLNQGKAFANIEKVGGFISGNPTPGSAMFKFGQSYGLLRMALTAAGIPYDEVHPRTWQKALGVSPRGKTESKSQFKGKLKQKAQQLFPKVVVTLKTCDALLLAEYCRRKCEGKL